MRRDPAKAAGRSGFTLIELLVVISIIAVLIALLLPAVHPAMVKLPRGDQEGRGVRRLGTFLLEVDGLTLTGTQVDDHGEEVDRFSLRKSS